MNQHQTIGACISIISLACRLLYRMAAAQVLHLHGANAGCETFSVTKQIQPSGSDSISCLYSVKISRDTTYMKTRFRICGSLGSRKHTPVAAKHALYMRACQWPPHKRFPLPRQASVNVASPRPHRAKGCLRGTDLPSTLDWTCRPLLSELVVHLDILHPREQQTATCIMRASTGQGEPTSSRQRGCEGDA